MKEIRRSNINKNYKAMQTHRLIWPIPISKCFLCCCLARFLWNVFPSILSNLGCPMSIHRCGQWLNDPTWSIVCDTLCKKNTTTRKIKATCQPQTNHGPPTTRVVHEYSWLFLPLSWMQVLKCSSRSPRKSYSI